LFNKLTERREKREDTMHKAQLDIRHKKTLNYKFKVFYYYIF